MGAFAALSGTDLTNLDGATTVKAYLSVIPETSYATARLNQSTFTFPLAELTVDTTSADWLTARAGMTVLIGSTAGGRDRGVYRLRGTPTSTTIPIMQISQGDTGLTPIAIRNTSFSDNDYVTILQTYDIWEVLPRILYSGGTTAYIYEDYDLTVGASNTTPEPIVNVTINGKPGHLVQVVASGTVAITSVASVTHWPTSVSATYSWAYPASFTGVSGGSTATLTATAPIGNHEIRCTVTPNAGAAITVIRHINIHDDLAASPTNPTVPIKNLSIRGDRTSWSAEFEAIDTLIASIPDGRMCLIYLESTFNGADITTRPNSIAGWITYQTYETEPGVKQTRVVFQGVGGVMGLIGANSQILTTAVSPANWQQVVSSLANANFAAWYMVRRRAKNLLELFDYNPISTSASSMRRTSIEISGGSNLLAQLQDLGRKMGGSNFGTDQAGSMFFVQHPNLIEYSSRSSLVTRDTLTAARYTRVSLERNRRPLIKRVRGEAFSSDGTTNTPLLSDAPGTTPGQGAGEQTYPGLFVASQSALNILTGMYYAYLNAEYPRATVEIPYFRDVYQPAQMQFVSLGIAADYSPTGSAITLNCIPDAVTIQIGENGIADITLTLEPETSGVAGSTVQVPEPIEDIYTPDDPYDPYIPPTDINPDSDIVVPPVIPPVNPGDPPVTTGDAALYNTADKFYRVYDISPSTWTCQDITPNGVTLIEMFMIDPSRNNSRGCYLLTNNGTDTVVYWTADVWATTVSWTAGGSTTGVYNKIIGRYGQPGYIEIYSPNSEAWSHTIDFTATDGGFVAPGGSGYTGTWTTSVGWEDSFLNGYRSIEAYLDIDSSTITSISMTWSTTPGDRTDWGPTQPWNYSANVAYKSGVSLPTYYSSNVWPSSTPNPLIWTGSATADRILILALASQHSDTTDGGGSCLITSLTVTGLGAKPSQFGGGGGGAAVATVAVSTNYGSSYSTQTPGDSTIYGGFDGTRSGTTTLAAKDEGGEKSTTIGGSFSNVTNLATTGTEPNCILIPWFKIGSTALRNYSTSPDFYFQSLASVSGESLWKVVSGTKTAITPTISGNDLLGTTDHGLSSWKGKKLLAIGDAGGTRYVAYSSNSGSSWASNALSGAVSVRCRRLSSTGNEWLVTRGSTTISYSTDGGATWTSKTVTGNAIYGEIWR